MTDRLLILDCDGVLVDSETLSAEVARDMAGRHGITMTHAEALSLIRGRKVASWVSELDQWSGTTLPADFIDEFRTRTAKVFTSRLRAVPGVSDAIQAIGIPYCVASSAPMAKIDHMLATTGLASLFGNNIYSAYEVGSWKPDPGLFLHAASDCDVSPANCVVVEDSVSGVRAGMAAGMTVLGYAPEAGGRAAELRAAGAHVFGDMSALPVLVGGSKNIPAISS